MCASFTMVLSRVDLYDIIRNGRTIKMRKLFNWAAARLVAAFALALPLAAMAAPNATAVWRSNLGQSYTIGGDVYALKIYGAGTDSAAGILNLDGTVTVTEYDPTAEKVVCSDFNSCITCSCNVLVKFRISKGTALCSFDNDMLDM